MEIFLIFFNYIETPLQIFALSLVYLHIMWVLPLLSFITTTKNKEWHFILSSIKMSAEWCLAHKSSIREKRASLTLKLTLLHFHQQHGGPLQKISRRSLHRLLSFLYIIVFHLLRSCNVLVLVLNVNPSLALDSTCTLNLYHHYKYIQLKVFLNASFS